MTAGLAHHPLGSTQASHGEDVRMVRMQWLNSP